MAISSTTAAFDNNILVFAQGTASEVLTHMTTAATYTGIDTFDKDKIILVGAYMGGSTASFAVLYEIDGAR